MPDSAGEETRAALLSLVDQQLFEPVIVRRGLVGPPEVRRATAVAVGRIGDPDGLEALYALLADDDAEVRREAAFAIGEVMEAPELVASENEARVRAAARLLDVVADPDRDVARLAVEALGKGGVSIATVAERLGRIEDEAERWARLLPALFRYPEPRAVALAADFLGGEHAGDPALRRWAAYALTREPRPEGLPHVRALLADADPRVQAWAARAIGRIGDASDLPRLFLLLASDEPGPMIHALRSARALVDASGGEPPAEWRGPLVKLVADPRPGVRVTAIETATAWLPDETLGRTLARLAAGEATPWERGTALVALAAGADPRAPGLASELAGSDDEELRARAAEAAGILEDEGLLAILADDRSARVRQAVLAARLAVAEQRGGEDAGTDLARVALRDSDAGVRTTALGWLVDHPVLTVPEVGAAFAPASADGASTERMIEERLTAIDALAALSAKRSAVAALAAERAAEAPESDPAVALLLSVTEAADLPVRRRAVEALAALGLPRPDPGHHPTRLSGAVYRSIVEQTAAPRTVEMVTRRGAVTLRLDCPRAPLTCLNFLQLVRQGFYDGLAFHRVVPDFVVQGGDPRGDGWGGPGYTIRDEIGRLRYDRGVVGMALAGPDTGGSQFFVTLAPHPHLDGGYTAFGEVVEGMEVLDQLRQGDRIVTVREVP